MDSIFRTGKEPRKASDKQKQANRSRQARWDTLKVVLRDLSFREVPRHLHESLLLFLRLLAPACPPFERQSDAFLLRRIPRISRIGEAKDIGLTTHVQTASSATEWKGLYLQLFDPLQRERRGHFTFEVRNSETRFG